MLSRNRDPEPDEWQERVRQPIPPSEVFVDHAISSVEIEPDVKELVEAKARYKVGFKSLRLECLRRNVKATLERRNRPTAFSLRN